MLSVPLRKIRAVQARPGYRLAIAWESGAGATVDLSDMIDRGGVFQDIAEKHRFAAVRVGENNRVVEWPLPADEDGYPIISIDGDALFEKASLQASGNPSVP